MSNQITITARKANKKRTKLRGGFYGPSGGGKTMSMLRVGTGLCRSENGGKVPAHGERGRILMVDSENGDSELYADRWDFDIVVLVDKTIAGYLAALQYAVDNGYCVVIYDSLSHAWRELLESVDRAKKESRGGNSFQAWADATPLQKEFIEALKSFPGHLLCSMRADTVWDVVENSQGKKEPKRMGLKPEQGKGIEYEFTFLCFIDTDHSGRVEKDRTGKFQDVRVDQLTEAFGDELAAWLNDGAKPVTLEQRSIIRELCKATRTNTAAFTTMCGGKLPDTFEEADAAIEKLRAIDPAKVTGDALAAAVAGVAGATPAPASSGAGATSTPSTATATASAGGTTATTTSASSVVDVAQASPAMAVNGVKPTKAKAKDPEPRPTDETDEEAEKAILAKQAELAALTAEAAPSHTTLLLAFKRALDSCKQPPEIATTIAAWTAKLDGLPSPMRTVANGYASGRLKELQGEPCTPEETHTMTALNEMTKE